MSKAQHTQWVKFDKPFHAVVDRMWISNITENANTENENVVCRVEGATEEECAERVDLILASPALLSVAEEALDHMENKLPYWDEDVEKLRTSLRTAINSAKPKGKE